MAKTMFRCLNIVALVCVCVCLGAQSTSVQEPPLGRNYDANQTETFEVEFDKINKYLSTRRTFKSVENDMENVVETFEINAKPKWWFNGAQQRALHLLATLNNITDPESLRCDEYANKIRHLCITSTRNLVLANDVKTERLSRLNQVVKFYLAKHSDACKQKSAEELS